MEFRTRVPVDRSPLRITHKDPVLFIGSCFAAEISERMSLGKMPVMANPAGTVYNPVSVLDTLEWIISGREVNADDLYFHDGLWLSFSHYTDFSSEDRTRVLSKINSRATEARDFIRKAKVLFVTFGTARIFRFRQTGAVVSNCHKIPSSEFGRELLTVDEIAGSWSAFLDRLNREFPSIKTVFTISPVRHWKDGAHGNQVSKSVLFLAIEELLKHGSAPGYFPAYEIMMDDLRDYRFYAGDMLHPSESAVDYIWESFCGSYLDGSTIAAWNEAASVVTASRHRISGEGEKVTAFAQAMLRKTELIKAKYPFIDFTAETEYFSSIIPKG